MKKPKLPLNHQTAAWVLLVGCLASARADVPAVQTEAAAVARVDLISDSSPP
jgi:hypothetical protein